MPQALTLGRSLTLHCPDKEFKILILKDESDNSLINQILRSDEYLEGSTAHHEAISLQDVSWESFDLLGAMNKYDLLEFATSLKPALLRDLLNRGWERVTYLDPDISVYKDFTDLFNDDSAISLTPHIFKDFPTDSATPNHQSILYAGMFNLGFISCTRDSLDFLNWWAWKLQDFCTIEIREGYHVDQKWVDFAPSFCATEVLKLSGLNVAYWNLHERSIRLNEESLVVDVAGTKSPLYFFHFSGFSDFENLELSKHASRIFSEETIPREFLSNYALERQRSENLISAHASENSILPQSWTLGARSLGKELHPDFRHKIIDSDRKLLNYLSSSRFSSHPARLLPTTAESLSDASLAWLLAHEHTIKQLHESNSQMVSNFLKLGFLATEIKSASNLAIEALKSMPRIKLVGYFGAPNGLGQIARNTSQFLKDSGVDFTVDTVPTPYDTDSLLQDLKSNYLPPSGKEDLLIAFINADVWEEIAIRGRKADPESHLVAAVWAWEIETIPPYFKHAARMVDEIFALSDFSATAIQKAIGKSVKEFPTYTSKTSFPSISKISLTELRDHFPQIGQKYILCRFDPKSVVPRKNPQGILEVWENIRIEFPDYKLVVKTSDFKTLAAPELLEAMLSASNVVLIDQSLSSELNEALMVHAQAYISMHRAEGLGLNILEAVFADIPAIYTDYSGLGQELAPIGFPVNFDLEAIGDSAHPYPPTGYWAEPDINHATEQLRLALQLVEDGQWKIGFDDREVFVKNFLHGKSEMILNTIDSLLHKATSIESRFKRSKIIRFSPPEKSPRAWIHSIIIPAWSLLPLETRKTWKPRILKLSSLLPKRNTYSR